MEHSAMITAERVTVAFETRRAVDEVSFTTAAGEWLGLIGPNGAGKSTLLRAIASLQRHRGLIRIDDRTIGALTQRRLARLVAYVPQNPEFPAGMTVLDYALLGRTPHLGYLGGETRDDVRHCFTLLERLGIGHLAHRMVGTLSGGERQRVALARALAQQAPVLLLDEPTSALDIGNRVEALELVDDLRRERNLAVVSAIHDLTLAAQFTDRLLLMADGRTVAVGNADDVLTECRLSALFGGHVHVIRDRSGAVVIAPVRAHTHLAGVNREVLGDSEHALR